MLFAGARLHTARVGCAVSVAVLSQHAARVESRRVCVFFVVWCLVYQYTIYAYGVYVCMCVSGAAHSASAPKTRATVKTSAGNALRRPQPHAVT